MRIAYVEDNTTNLALVERVARMTKHSITSYTEGEIALEALQTEPFDLILMDVELAGELSGLQVVRKLRDGGLSTPIIAVTAYAMMGDRERCIEAGCNDYLPKPLPINDFIMMLAKYDALLNQPVSEIEYLNAPPADQNPVAAETESASEITLRTKTRLFTKKATSELVPPDADIAESSTPAAAEVQSQPKVVKPAEVIETDTKPAATPALEVAVVDSPEGAAVVESKPVVTSPAPTPMPSGLTTPMPTVVKAAETAVEIGIKPPLEPLSPKVQHPVSQPSAKPVTVDTQSKDPKDAASVTQSDAAH